MKAFRIGATALTLLLVTPQLTRADLAPSLSVYRRARGLPIKSLGPANSGSLGERGLATCLAADTSPINSWPKGNSASAAIGPGTHYAYNTMAFGSGPYRVEGDNVFMRYDNSWNQASTGTERVQTMQINGEALTWTSAPSRRLTARK